MKRLIFTFILLAIFLGYGPRITVNGIDSISIEQETVRADIEMIGDDFEYAEEWPEMWDAGCIGLCYGPGWGCEDWTGTGVGYETSCLGAN